MRGAPNTSKLGLIFGNFFWRMGLERATKGDKREKRQEDEIPFRDYRLSDNTPGFGWRWHGMSKNDGYDYNEVDNKFKNMPA